MSMSEAEAIRICEEIIKINRGIITEARKNNDINLMQLTANCDTESIAIETLIAEIEKKDKRISDLEYTLLDMIMQFADRPRKSGCEYFISTMGLSTLELAFSELNLDDPTPIRNANAIYEKLQKQYFEKKVKEQ